MFLVLSKNKYELAIVIDHFIRILSPIVINLNNNALIIILIILQQQMLKLYKKNSKMPMLLL